MSYCIMILVAASALYLEPINKEGLESAAGCFGCDALVEVSAFVYGQLSVTTSDVEHDIARIVG